MYRALAQRALLITISVSLFLSVFACAGPIGVVQSSGPTYAAQSAIHINNNTDLVALRSSGLSTGSGTISDPYVINGYAITGIGGACIYIGNTTGYLVISGCYLHGNSYGVELWSSSNVTMRDNNCSGNSNYGIYLVSSSKNVLANNACNDTLHGIYLVSSSNNNVILNNTCRGMSACGIMLSASSGNILSNNTSSFSGNNGLHVDSSSNHNIIANNTFNGNNLNGISLTHSSANNNITHNICIGNKNCGICLNGSSVNNVINNTCSGSSFGIQLWSSSNVTVSNNTCNGNSYYGIYLVSSSKNVLANNACNDTLHGIYLIVSSNNNAVLNDTCRGMSACGIMLSASSGNILSNNTSSFSGNNGLHVDSSSNHNIIANNTFNGNNKNGVSLTRSSSNNTITHNKCIGNNLNGVCLNGSSFNNVINNTCIGNAAYGICLQTSSNNSVRANSLSDNNGASSAYNASHVQAYDDGKNSWNSSSSGNYWADHLTPDANADGIVDTPYAIAGGSGVDHYPIASPTTVITDTTDPTLILVSPANNSLHNGSVTVSWTANDASGIARTEVSVDGAAWTKVSGTIDVLTLVDGPHVVKVKVTDNAGNSNETSVTFTVDKTGPTIIVVSPANNSLHNGSVTVSWTANDASGIARTEVSVDGAAWSDAQGTTDVLALAEGSHLVKLKVTDNAGNFNETSVTFTVDKTAPTMIVNSPLGKYVACNASVSLTFNEAMNESSVNATINGTAGAISWRGNNAVLTPSRSLAYDTTYTVSVSGKDLAGNSVFKTWNFTTQKNEGSISGIITGPDGKALDNAVVKLNDGTSTTTDARGFFEFRNVTSGHYTLTVEKSGYENRTVEVTVGAGATSTVDTMTMTASAAAAVATSSDSTLLILVAVAVVAVIAAVGLLLFLRKRKSV